MDSWIVSHRCDGCSTRSYRPTSTGLADSFCTASLAHLAALPTRSCSSTYSHPRAIGWMTLLRVWKSPGAVAVACQGTELRTMVWVITEPSLFAKLRSSLTKASPEVMNCTPFTDIAAAFALSSSSARSSIGIVNGSMVNALFQVTSLCTGAGASCTALSRAIRFAFATATASRAARATPSVLSWLLAANPHVPSTSARMPAPTESVSAVLTICCSRVNTTLLRYRPMRTSE
jgi:hypothetical protein